MLITKQFVKCPKLDELEYSVVLQVGCHEDLVDILQFLRLQLIGCVDHKLGEVIQLHCLLVRVEMQVFL